MKVSGLLTDFYALTMVNVYRRVAPDTRATFDLFIRTLPRQRAFVVACGMADAVAYLRSFSFSSPDIAYLRRLGFEPDFLKFLRASTFSGDVWSVPEGTFMFPEEPIMRITAPLCEAQLVEACLLNTVNVQTTLATKALRVVMAAGPAQVVDFSLRRTQGAQASLDAARAGYIGGCVGTSNVLAGKLYDINVVGTMAHSYVMSFESELESFRAYARMFPDRTILLVDTYDYRQGVRNAIIVARELKAKGFRLFGVRLDSGDLAKESKKIRAMLDRSGLNAVKIVVSGNLDEYKIERLRRAKAPIDIFGVGTNMGVSADAPYCDVIYKISEITDRRGVFTPTMKLSAHKVTFPGRKQVYRRRDRRGRLLRDVLVLEGERGAGTPLLSKVMERGKPCSAGTRLEQVRRYVQNQLADLPSRYKRLKPEAVYPVAKSARLVRLSLAKKQQLERSRRAERLEYVATKRMK